MELATKSNSKGITLIALVITIIVLLILAGVTLSLMLGENGLLQKAGNAKVASEIGEEKDIIGLSVMQARSSSMTETLEKDALNAALAQNSKSDNIATVLVENPSSFVVQFSTSKRYYNVSGSKIEEFEVDEWATVKFVNKSTNGEIAQEFSSYEMQCPIISNTFSITPPKIAGYEPEEDVVTDSSKIVTDVNGNKTITIEYYKILTDADLVFTSYTENGEEKYMLGDGTRNNQNALKEKEVKSVLYVPETYNGKIVGKIGQWAFRTSTNIIKINISDKVNTIEYEAFDMCSKTKELKVNAKVINSERVFGRMSELQKVEIGENVTKLGVFVFWNCTSLSDFTIYSENLDLWAGTMIVEGDTALKEIKTNANNNSYTTLDGILYSKDKTDLILCPPGKEMEGGTFEIPSHVNTIKSSAFRNNTNITNLIIKDNVDKVEFEAFMGCRNIESIYLNSKNMEGNTPFGGLTKLKTVIMGENVQNLCYAAFNNDNVWDSFTYEGTVEQWNNITKVDRWNNGCTSLTKVICLGSNNAEISL